MFAELYDRFRAPRELFSEYRKYISALLLLTCPNVLTFVVSLSIPFSSALYVGHLGPQFLAAAALGNMVANAFGFAIGSGLSMALDTLCSQAFGAKKYTLVGLHCQRMMVILSLLCFPITLVWLQTEFLLDIVGMPKEVSKLAAFWVKLLIPGMLPRFLFECLRRYTLSQRIVWPVTVSVSTTAFFHIIDTGLLVYILEFGYWGAALSATISNWILFLSLLALTLWNHREKPTHSLLATSPPSPSSSSSPLSTSSPSPQDLEEGATQRQEDTTPTSTTDDEDSNLSSNESIKAILPSAAFSSNFTVIVPTETTWPSPWTMDLFEGWWEILCLGIPSAISLVLEWGSYEVTSALAGQLGTIPLATHLVLQNTAGLWYQVPTGFAIAASTLIGNALGAGAAADAQRTTRVAYVFAALWALLNGAIFTFVLRQVWGMAFSNDWRVVQLTGFLMPIMWCYGFWDAIKCVGMACLRGCGRPLITVAGNLISCLLIGFPMCFLLTFVLDLGLPGLWAGMACSWLCAGMTYGYILYYTDWQEEVAKAELRNMRALSTITPTSVEPDPL